MAPILRMILAAALVSSLAAAHGCSAQGASNNTTPPADSAGSNPDKEPERVPVTIAGRVFKLEPALDDKTRTLGLGGRTEIAEDGGMIFVFPEIARRDFVMRDCPIPIDILYLDGAGRVLTTHAMVPEAPRSVNEAPTDPIGNSQYEQRLKRYPSRYPTGIVVELRGGMIKELGVKPGDKLEFDAEGLKKRAR